MSQVALLREQIQQAHYTWTMTVGDVTNEVAHWQPPGTAHNVGARYAHALVAEDNLIAMLKGSPPLHATTFKGSTGASDPQQLATPEWAKALRVDVSKLNQYAKAVYDQTDQYLATLKDEELERTIDLTQFGLGVVNVRFYLSRLIVAHAYECAGEVYAVKGLQGLRGSPY